MTASLSADGISMFLLVLTRVSGLILSAPLIGDAETPRLVKAGVAIALSVVLAQTPALARANVPAALLPFILAVLAQLLVGVTLGFVARAVFFAVQTAGQLVSLQIGLSTASVFNPMSRLPDAVTVQLYTVIAALTFLAVQGDTWLVASLARSFDLAPLGATAFTPALLREAINAALAVTQIGVQIALPIAVSLFGANVALGVLSRALPQLNVFVLSLPLDLLLGLLALGGSLTGIVLVMEHLFGNMPGALLTPLLGTH